MSANVWYRFSEFEEDMGMFRQKARAQDRLAGIATAAQMERLRNVEKQIAKMRWPTIIIPALIMPFILEGRLLVYGGLVLGFDLLYNAAFTLVIDRAPLRITPWLSWSSIVIDTLFLTFLVAVTGGYDSAYFVAYYAIAIAVSMRFGILPNVISGIISALCYALAMTWANGPGVWSYAMATFAARVIFLVMVSLIVGYLSEEKLSINSTNRALQVAIRRLTAANETAQALSFPSDLWRALEMVALKVAEISDVPESRMLLVGDQLSMSQDGVPPSEGSRLVQVTLGELASQYPAGMRALDEKRIVMASGPHGEEDGGQNCVSIPITTRERSFGVLTLWTLGPEHEFLQDEIDQLDSIGSQIATTIENARLYDDTQRHLAELEQANRQLQETQQQLIQTEKLAAIGQLAAGVAHEINNPMAVILGFAQTLLQHYATDDMWRAPLQEIESEALRCRRIVQNLLAFSRRREPARQPTDLSLVMQDALQLLRHQAYLGNVEIVEEWVDGLPLIQADAQELQQVYVNLLLNAVQAMPNGGRLTLRTRVDGTMIVGEVQDTGTGIPKSILSHIFDPFFTTKEVGKGTGLGLSVSYGIVERHGGTITVESQEGVGTTFAVRLPLIHADS